MRYFSCSCTAGYILLALGLSACDSGSVEIPESGVSTGLEQAGGLTGLTQSSEPTQLTQPTETPEPTQANESTEITQTTEQTQSTVPNTTAELTVETELPELLVTNQPGEATEIIESFPSSETSEPTELVVANEPTEVEIINEPTETIEPVESLEPVESFETLEPFEQAETSEPTVTVDPDTQPALPAAVEPSVLTNQTSLVLVNNNVSGGGFQSDVTITDDGLTVYSSADVSGIFKSSNGGLRYENQNEGLRSSKVASLAITPDNPQILYAGTGEKGGSGGLFRSTNGGESWTLTGDGTKAQFAGNHSATSDPVPVGHPRSNGDLIVVDEGGNPSSHTDDIIIAGTYKNGVRIFTQGGENEAGAANTSGFVRSLAHNSSLPDTVFAAIQFTDDSKNGIYRITYADPSSPESTLEFQTLRPEGLTVLSNGHVYGAIGDEGIVKYNGTSWFLQTSGLATNNFNRQWTAVTGYVLGNNDVVYAGINNLGGTANGSNYSAIWRSLNGGNSWTPLVDANSNVSDQIYGQSYEWWYRTDAFPQAGLGRTNNVVSSIEVARGSNVNSVADDIIYVSGRGGIWKSENGGDLWEPAVFNMQATANNGVAVNPNDPSQVVLANTDYVVLETGNRYEGNDVSRDKPKGSESRGYDVIFDVVSNELILGVGDRDRNEGGEVFVKSATAIGSPSGSGWTNTDLGAATSTDDGRARAVAYGYHDGTSSTSQTILAAVEGEGVYRYQNGNWTKSSGVSIGSTDRSNFIWPDSSNSGVVYLLDLSTGFYRSKDGGQNWTDIWPTMDFNNNDFFNTGYIAADDDNPTTLYLSIQGRSGSPIGTRFKVYRMSGADTGTFGPPGTSGRITDITLHSGNTQINRPGPIVFGPDGKLWLTQQQDSQNSIDASLFVMENPTTDVSFTDVTTNKYRNNTISPSGIDVSSDGYVYISQNGVGIVKISLP